MIKNQKSPLIKWVASSLLVVGSLSMNTVMAQSLAVECPGYKQGPTKIPGQRVGKKVQRAFEAYNTDQIEEAIAILKEIESSDDFDQAYVYRFLGNLLAAKDGEGKNALDYLLKTVQTKVLNDSEHASTLRLVGDLNMQEKQYGEAIKWYDEWMKFTCKEDADIYTRQAQAFYETKQLAKMIAPADKAIALYDKPNKNPYVLKMTSYYERKMYPETIKVAEQLVKMFPETKQWWTQLGFFYMLVEDYAKALQTFELAYTQGYLEKASEIKALVQLYATNEIPYQSAVLHEKFLKSGLLKKDASNLSAIANSWHRAKEHMKAATYYGEAAALSSDPEHYRKQGTLLLGAEKYPQALDALQKALDSGSKKEGAIHMAMMEAYFYQGKFKQAYQHIQEAKKDKSTARNAAAWEPYVKEKAKNRGIKLI
ncbi:tetratricopeptide repeat protein [Paraneptunicella aestuarii]|uniref:tetratricopeptide repeat protein n=1 Tax=Paraneptunicella aestuarii TaxID=2831148 RepID=UPI0038CD9BC4|nr:tetratricopeptide repeat protein [Paraneptunicella aestuarii]